jgi:hypothetical protein
VYRSLAGRIGAADDKDVRIGNCRCLGRARAIEHTSADECLDARNTQAAIGDAGGKDDRSRNHLGPVVEPNDAVSTCIRELDGGSPNPKLGSERPRLLLSPAHELSAGDTAGKPEVVPDERARTGLPTESHWLDNDDPETFGGTVDGRCQAGRP